MTRKCDSCIAAAYAGYTGRRDIEWEQWTVFQNAQSEYSAIIYALCTGKMGLYAEI